MSKKHKNRPSFMLEWDNCLPTDDGELIMPLRKILLEGYKIERKPIVNFNYAGFNIGEQDKIYSPTPQERFSSRWLSNEAKFNRTLIDNVLMTMFLLGKEKGRREQSSRHTDPQILEDIIEQKVTETNFLRAKLAKYEPEYVINSIPDVSENKDLIFADSDLDDVDAESTKEEG